MPSRDSSHLKRSCSLIGTGGSCEAERSGRADCHGAGTARQMGEGPGVWGGRWGQTAGAAACGAARTHRLALAGPLALLLATGAGLLNAPVLRQAWCKGATTAVSACHQPGCTANSTAACSSLQAAGPTYLHARAAPQLPGPIGQVGAGAGRVEAVVVAEGRAAEESCAARGRRAGDGVHAAQQAGTTAAGARAGCCIAGPAPAHLRAASGPRAGAAARPACSAAAAPGCRSGAACRPTCRSMLRPGCTRPGSWCQGSCRSGPVQGEVAVKGLAQLLTAWYGPAWAPCRGRGCRHTGSSRLKGGSRSTCCSLRAWAGPMQHTA